jgi:hypothetical protein
MYGECGVKAARRPVKAEVMSSIKSFHARENSDQDEGPGGRGLKFPGLMGLYAK